MNENYPYQFELVICTLTSRDDMNHIIKDADVNMRPALLSMKSSVSTFHACSVV